MRWQDWSPLSRRRPGRHPMLRKAPVIACEHAASARAHNARGNKPKIKIARKRNSEKKKKKQRKKEEEGEKF
jgi:hypothetical protein